MTFLAWCLINQPQDTFTCTFHFKRVEGLGSIQRPLDGAQGMVSILRLREIYQGTDFHL